MELSVYKRTGLDFVAKSYGSYRFSFIRWLIRPINEPSKIEATKKKRTKAF